MHIFTTASAKLAISKNEIQLQKLPSDVVWYLFLVALLAVLLLAQPDQRQSTGRRPTNLVTGSAVLQAR